MGRRVLVVDDLIQVAESIRDELRSYFEVDIATSGVEAMRLLRKNRYDGLVVDVELEAGISGLELVARVRAHDRAIPILLVSAVVYTDDVRRRAVDLGATFCEKPVSSDTILRELGVARG